MELSYIEAADNCEEYIHKCVEMVVSFLDCSRNNNGFKRRD